MNTNPNKNTMTSGSPEPLDAFEERWVAALRQPEPGDRARDEAFVDGVLDRWEGETHMPVLAKIGWTHYVAAAAVLFAAVVGWAVLRGQSTATTPGGSPVRGAIAEDPAPEDPAAPEQTRIADRSEAERRELARSLQLGTMIAGTSDSLSKPAAALPKTLDDTANNFSLQGLTRGLTAPIPDPAQSPPPRTDNPRG